MSGTTVGTALFTPAELAQAGGGELVCRSGRRITSVAADSRQVQPGSLFVPLAGQRTDGHRFLADALRRGASALLIARREWERCRGEVLAEAERRGATLVRVEDPLAALQDLARFHLRRWPALERFGVTGSNGKTTTKEILGSILAEEGATVVNEGNLNSEIGLPLSVFRAGYVHRYAVFEMGINHPGEMDVLADIVRPDAAVITHVGRAHIGLMGSVEGIAEEKRKIFRFFDGHQKAFLFEDEPHLERLGREVRGKVVTFGPRSTPGYRGSRSLGLDGTAIDWEGLQVRFPLFGQHNLWNALAAMTVSIEWGVSPSKIRAGLEKIRPLSGRSQILRGEITIVHDGYNANPDSVARLLEFVRALEWKGRKAAVLGSMLELGGESAEAHRQVGRMAASAGLDRLFLYGPEMEEAWKACAADAAPRTAPPAGAAPISSAPPSAVVGTAPAPGVEWFTDMDRLAERLRRELRSGDLVALKGSRGVELERLIPAIQRAGT